MKRGPDNEKTTLSQEKEEMRWSHVLAEVSEEYRAEGPWWRRLGIFVAWSAGIAGAAAVLVTMLVLIVDLFSAQRLFSALNISNWIFWASALLMGIGMLSPVAGEVENLPGQKEESKEKEAKKDKEIRTARRRIRRVYNPWRWRFWAAAVLSFALSILVGLAA